MNAIEAFQKKRNELATARGWAGLIGRPYCGGGGGIGEVRSADAGFTIYHQPTDGATNYHTNPTCLRPYIERVVLSDATSIIGRALDLMAADVAEAARKARAEAEEVLAMAAAPEGEKEGERNG